nr:protein C45G9.6 [imported] - Caenorhabditis elegans [Caenorhabditis elegans]
MILALLLLCSTITQFSDGYVIGGGTQGVFVQIRAANPLSFSSCDHLLLVTFFSNNHRGTGTHVDCTTYIFCKKLCSCLMPKGLPTLDPGGNQNNPNSPTYNGGIGGGVYPGGGGNNGGVQRDEGGYCNSNTDCRSGLYCTASVNGVKICLSTSNGGGGNGFPSGNGGCQTSSNCQYGSVCVVTNGQGNCQIQTGGYVSPARQGMVRYPSSNSITVDFNEDVFSKNAPEPGKINSGCERDADCDDELSCTMYFGEMMCRSPIKPLIPLRCESDAECPSTEYLCVFSTAMQDRVCYKYGDVVTDGYVIPIKHKISMELKKSTTTSSPPITTTHLSKPEESNGLFAESEAIFEQPGSLLTSALQKRADKMSQNGPTPPMYVKMSDIPSEHVIAGQHDGEAVRITKVVVKEEKEMEENGETREKVIPKIGEGVGMVDDEPIDPMATCRMGESCSGRVRFVDRNVTVCRYDMFKKHRQCLYHSDCISGQRCTPTGRDIATCETDISATIGSIQCFYDYECSGGEKCTLVDEKERKFVCRPSPTSDPRMNQICTTNSQCPFQQVCAEKNNAELLKITISMYIFESNFTQNSESYGCFVSQNSKNLSVPTYFEESVSNVI